MLNGRDISQNLAQQKLWNLFFYKLSTFTKTRISPNLINIFKFGFDHTKSSEIYYKKQLSFENFEIFWPEILHFKWVNQDEWNTL